MPSLRRDRNVSPTGFTLIEMLIVIMIFTLITTGAVVTYRNFSRRQQVLQSAKVVQELMRFAQKKARVGEKPSSCAILNGYRVTAGNGATEVVLTADCTNNDYIVTRGSLIGSAHMSNAVSMTFKVISGGVSGSGAVDISLGSYTYEFTVSRAGEISEGDFQ